MLQYLFVKDARFVWNILTYLNINYLNILYVSLMCYVSVFEKNTIEALKEE